MTESHGWQEGLAEVAAVKTADEASLTPSSGSRTTWCQMESVNNHAGVPSMKTHKYSGRSTWEAFQAQVLLLAQTAGQ